MEEIGAYFQTLPPLFTWTVPIALSKQHAFNLFCVRSKANATLLDTMSTNLCSICDSICCAHSEKGRKFFWSTSA